MQRKYLFRLAVVLVVICLIVDVVTVRLIILHPERKTSIGMTGAVVGFAACLLAARIIVKQSRKEKGE